MFVPSWRFPMLRICYALFVLLSSTLSADTIEVEYTPGTRIGIFSLVDTRKDVNDLVDSFKNLDSDMRIDNIYFVTSDEYGTVNNIVIVARDSDWSILSDDSDEEPDSLDLYP